MNNMNPGQIIQNRYRIDRILGKGSMGTTYKAFDAETRNAVAVKLLHFSRVQEWKVLEMFEREARILQQLAHPRIPSYIDYFSLDSAEGAGARCILVQEYIDGKPLQYLVEKGWRGTETEILDIFWQLIHILAYLHTLNPPVIHRDINPKNILLSSMNEVFLVDFGAVQERIRTTFLGGSTIVGTYGYVPFEQFSGHTVPASDYYAAGATLLYMLSHRNPADFPAEEMKPQFHDALTVSPGLITLLDGLLEPSAKQRIASADQVRAILETRTTSSQSAFSRTSHVAKPDWSKIERIEVGPQALRFRIPKRLMKIIPGQTVLDLTADSVKFLDAYKIGKKLGQSWTIAMSGLRPSDVTWYFEHGKPLIGINAQGATHVISSSLALAEIHWLLGELREFIARARIALLPDATRKTLKLSGSGSLLLPVGTPIKPKDTRIQRSGDAAKQLTLRIPRHILPPSAKPGATFRRELIEFVELFLGKRTIEISPAWVQVSTTYFGLKIGQTHHIPTSSIQAADITCFFKKISSSSGSALRHLVVGLNYGERTLELANQLTQEEADWLMHEIGQYLTQHAEPSGASGKSPEAWMNQAAPKK